MALKSITRAEKEKRKNGPSSKTLTTIACYKGHSNQTWATAMVSSCVPHQFLYSWIFRSRNHRGEIHKHIKQASPPVTCYWYSQVSLILTLLWFIIRFWAGSSICMLINIHESQSLRSKCLAIQQTFWISRFPTSLAVRVWTGSWLGRWALLTLHCPATVQLLHAAGAAPASGRDPWPEVIQQHLYLHPSRVTSGSSLLLSRLAAPVRWSSSALPAFGTWWWGHFGACAAARKRECIVD